MPKTGLFLFQNEPETEEGPDHETHLEASEQVFTIQWRQYVVHICTLCFQVLSVCHIQFQSYNSKCLETAESTKRPVGGKFWHFFWYWAKAAHWVGLKASSSALILKSLVLRVHLPKHYTPDLQISLRTSAPGHFWKLAVNCWKVVFFFWSNYFCGKNNLY